MSRAFVGMGSNVEPERHLRDALLELRRRYPGLIQSTVYRNAAVGWDGDDFLNLVVGFDCGSPPASLVEDLHGIERTMGRSRGGTPRYGPRPLDLDLLMHGRAVIEAPGLRLPRREILEQAFVLGPLAEIAGDVVHPVTGRTIAEHWAAFDRARHAMVPVIL